MTAGLDLRAIREALADQIRNRLERPTNVRPYDTGDPFSSPQIVIRYRPTDSMSYFETFGPNGSADVYYDVTVYVAARTIDTQIAIDDYLSAGIGNGSSILDAIMSDRTLGGVVGDVSALTATIRPWRDGDPDALTGTVHVRVITSKIGAQA